jgi:hypothetical protein
LSVVNVYFHCRLLATVNQALNGVSPSHTLLHMLRSPAFNPLTIESSSVKMFADRYPIAMHVITPDSIEYKCPHTGLEMKNPATISAHANITMKICELNGELDKTCAQISVHLTKRDALIEKLVVENLRLKVQTAANIIIHTAELANRNSTVDNKRKRSELIKGVTEEMQKQKRARMLSIAPAAAPAAASSL